MTKRALLYTFNLACSRPNRLMMDKMIEKYKKDANFLEMISSGIKIASKSGHSEIVHFLINHYPEALL